jgi:hypothetical protein
LAPAPTDTSCVGQHQPGGGTAKTTRRAVLFAVAIGVLTAAPGRAQIYSWSDANGRKVYSDRPAPGAPAPVEMRVAPVRPAAPEPVQAAEGSDPRGTSYAPTPRSRPYESLIVEHARLHGVRPELVRAVVQVESAFNPAARSIKGAMGLMQLMPGTARDLGVTDPYDPAENVGGGVRYLRQLLDRYSNDERLAVAAYNAGPGSVDRYGQSVPPFRETRDYVARIDRIAGARVLAVTEPVVVPAMAPPAWTRIVRQTTTVNGREVVRYTNRVSDEGRDEGREGRKEGR